MTKPPHAPIPDPECLECGDTGPWIDCATELCEMCFEHIFGTLEGFEE